MHVYKRRMNPSRPLSFLNDKSADDHDFESGSAATTPDNNIFLMSSTTFMRNTRFLDSLPSSKRHLHFTIAELYGPLANPPPSPPTITASTSNSTPTSPPSTTSYVLSIDLLSRMPPELRPFAPNQITLDTRRLSNLFLEKNLPHMRRWRAWDRAKRIVDIGKDGIAIEMEIQRQEAMIKIS